MNEPWVIKKLMEGGGGGGKPGVPYDTDSTNKKFALGIGTNGKIYLNTDSSETATVSSGETIAWGNITGTLSNQTDLQGALTAKIDKATGTQSFIIGKDDEGLYYEG